MALKNTMAAKAEPRGNQKQSEARTYATSHMQTARHGSKLTNTDISVPKRQASSPESLDRVSTVATARTVRKGLGISQPEFARLSGFSTRAIADWERGQKMSEAGRQRIAELKRLQTSLASVINPDHISTWLRTPNPAFNGLKPMEVIERGEIDRIWRMIFYLESGSPT